MAAKRKKQKQISKKQMIVRDVDTSTRDSGAVRVGGMVRALLPNDPATHDAGKVRIGGMVTRLPREE